MNRNLLAVTIAALFTGCGGEASQLSLVSPLEGDTNPKCASGDYCNVALQLNGSASVDEILAASTAPVARAVAGVLPANLFVIISANQTSVGGKMEEGSISFTCTRPALDEIDWNGIQPDGIRKLCSVDL